MGFSKILYFLHHLSIELQIDQMRLRIAVNGYGFIEMPQSLRIKSDIDHSLCPRSDRSLCPPGYGAGAIGLHVGKYQRLVTCVRNGVLHRTGCSIQSVRIVRLRIGVKRGCATAVNAVAASAYKVIKLRFIYIVSKLAAQM